MAPTVKFSDIEGCYVFNTVRSARAVVRRYDNRLKPFGVTLLQFAVLAYVREFEGASISTMAKRLSMDRSTLSRNIDTLTRNGFVEKMGAEAGNTRSCCLTKKGRQVIETLLARWLSLREEWDAAMPKKRQSEYLETLRWLAGDKP